MKHQRVANRKERLYFEDLLQQDRIRKTSVNNNISLKVGSTPQSMNNNMNYNNNHLNVNEYKLNPYQNHYTNVNNQVIANNSNNNRNNLSDRRGINNISKRDRVWEEKRNKKINSEYSIKQTSYLGSNKNIYNSNMDYNSKIVNNNHTPKPFDQNSANELNYLHLNDRNRNVTPNVQQNYQEAFTPQTNVNHQLISENKQTILPTPHSATFNHQQINTNNIKNISQNPNSKTSVTNPPLNNQINYNTIKTNYTNSIRNDHTLYSTTPYSVESNNKNNNNQNNLPNNQTNRIFTNPQNNKINNIPPTSTPNNLYQNQFNIGTTPGYRNSYSYNHTPFVIQNSTTTPPMQSQFNKTTPYHSNMNNNPIRNVINQTPSIANYNTNNGNNTGNYYSMSKPGSSQINKPFMNENISFRNVNSITPGNTIDNSRNNSAYSAYLGRENNKFVFDKKNVIY